MKKVFCILFYIYNSINIYSQDTIVHNIFLHKFGFPISECYEDKKGNLVFFTKIYATDELKLGIQDINDSLTAKKISMSKNKHNYVLKEIYEKDTLENTLNLTKFTINKTIDSKDLKKVVFKKIPSKRLPFDCNETRYINVLLLKSFFMTHSFVSEDDASKKYTLKLIDENCNIAIQEDFDRNLLYSQNDHFLMFKDNDRLIVVFDKYL